MAGMERMVAFAGRLKAEGDACLQKMDGHQGRMEANMNAWRDGNN
jgi:hypothetical protein